MHLSFSLKNKPGTIMKLNKIHLSFSLFLGAFFLLAFAASIQAQSPPNITVNNYLRTEKVAPGRVVQAVVEMDIPGGYHVNSSKPLEKFLISTQLSLEPSRDLKVGPVSYPRAVVRKLKFSKNPVSVYEGKVVMRFNITVPANFYGDGAEVRARLRYQSCSDELCFPPQTREVKFWVRVGK
jgi:thiol:disulfide interchange protein